MFKLTLQQILEPIEATCGKCGSEATIYPYPSPEGTCFCPVCSPAWVGDFVKSASERMKEEAQK